VDAYGRLSAIMGVELFPTMRSAQEILADEGVSSAATAATIEVKCRAATPADNPTPNRTPFFSRRRMRSKVGGNEQGVCDAMDGGREPGCRVRNAGVRAGAGRHRAAVQGQ